MTLETRSFVSSQTGEREGKELENSCFTFTEQYLLKLGKHSEKKKVAFIGPEDNEQKHDPIAESVDSLL